MQLTGLPKSLSVSFIFKHLITWYESRSKKLKPSALKTRASIYSQILKLDKLAQLNFNARVRDYIRNLTLNNCFKVEKAPQIKWLHLFNLAEKLFEAEFPKYKNSKFKRKAAALAIYFSTYGALRWGDIVRIKWQDIMKIVRKNTTYILFRLRVTKTCFDGSLNQSIVFPFLGPKFRWRCPVWVLIKFWRYAGSP